MAATGTNANSNTGTLSERLSYALAQLSLQQRALLLVAIAAFIALAVASNTWLKQADYRILFSNITERDGGNIVAALDQMNIPYRFNESGGAILIPGSKVHEVRLRLATQGLPKGGAVGFELMENQKFGISQFAEQVNYQRGLEGELSRTIQSIGAVQTARVHLAIPKPTVFVREEIKPSASVLIHLYGGRSLEPSQIAGIQNLVAASVPNLLPTSVTLIDQSGQMLSQLRSKLMDAGLDPTQIKYVREIEASAIKRVEDILTPIVGSNNFRVQVAADVDFSQSEQTAETHRPNGTPPETSIRSQQSSETVNASASAQGVPGALSNQPPAPPTAPVTQPALPGAPGQPGQPAQAIPGQLNAAGVQAPITNVGQPISTRKDSTINYEVDRTIKHTKQAVGTIKRLSAAVVVNHRKDAKGVTKGLSDTEIKQINELVREALGFNKERGDTVSVANAPFAPSDKPDNDMPIWKDPDVTSTLKSLLTYAAILGIGAYLLLKIILPLLKVLMATPPQRHQRLPGSKLDIVAGDDEDQGPTNATILESKLAATREIAKSDPKVVANIIKDWTGANASG